MAIANVIADWVGGNQVFRKRSDRSIVGGIVAVSGATTKAGAVLAVPITHRFVTMTTGGVEALTLANGAPGQLLTITLGTDGGDGTLTPATCTGFATIVFADAKDTVTLLYVDDTVGWVLVGYYGTAAPPVVS
jgi:hypothetical protein